mmetsp:Transcript_63220/g.181825  ORF Transcript_63220/g.181825 Transcript_63220/m.181825 type:complete len:218 (-) Transcript_63220:719-1372(-)
MANKVLCGRHDRPCAGACVEADAPLLDELGHRLRGLPHVRHIEGARQRLPRRKGLFDPRSDLPALRPIDVTVESHSDREAKQPRGRSDHGPKLLAHGAHELCVRRLVALAPADIPDGEETVVVLPQHLREALEHEALLAKSPRQDSYLKSGVVDGLRQRRKAVRHDGQVRADEVAQVRVSLVRTQVVDATTPRLIDLPRQGRRQLAGLVQCEQRPRE